MKSDAVHFGSKGNHLTKRLRLLSGFDANVQIVSLCGGIWANFMRRLRQSLCIGFVNDRQNDREVGREHPNGSYRPIADISKALSLSAMRISVLLFLPCYAVLISCEQPSEHPEVAYRYCMAELARESARTGEVTFEEATAFSHECQRFAVEAATLRSREELGAKFDAQSSETVSHIRDNLQMIVRAHVCAFASERDLQRCTPIM